MRIGLVLGGGAVRGLAHLGVLTVLERERIPIHCVAGSSVGSLIGAAYAAGIGVKELKEIAAAVGWRKIASLTWSGHGFVSFAKLERWLAGFMGDLNFSDLPKAFAVVATDLESGEPVVLDRERVAPAVRASCTVPGIVAPIRRNGRFLVDGGVSDNVPVSVARTMGADYVIAVDVCHPMRHRRWGPLGIGFRTIEIMVRRAGSGIADADCLISPDLAGFGYVRFSRREEMIARGARAAEEKLPIIKARLAENL